MGYTASASFTYPCIFTEFDIGCVLSMHLEVNVLPDAHLLRLPSFLTSTCSPRSSPPKSQTVDDSGRHRRLPLKYVPATRLTRQDEDTSIRRALTRNFQACTISADRTLVRTSHMHALARVRPFNRRAGWFKVFPAVLGNAVILLQGRAHCGLVTASSVASREEG